MKITKELTAKINRAFEAKEKEALVAYYDAIEGKTQETKEKLTAELVALQDSMPVCIALLKDMATNRWRGANHIPSLEDVVNAVVNHASTPEVTEARETRDKALADLRMAKENFLIKISYAEDFNMLQAAFAEAGMEW